MSSFPFEALSAPTSGFLCDPRFASDASFQLARRAPPPDFADPVAAAWQKGYDEALASARLDAERAAGERDATVRQLELRLGTIEAETEAALAEKLRLTVLALCARAIAPLAVDEKALLRRISQALELLRRTSDDCTLVLHPDDLALLRLKLPEAVRTLPDPSLERGGLRLETASGGIEDGPAQWRRLIEEAFDRC